MKNLLSLSKLSVKEIMDILEVAEDFSKGYTYSGLAGKKVINLFFEPSTRTHYSFNAAEQNLGMIVTNFNVISSSVKKGESIYDTIKTLDCMGYDAMVIRHPNNNYYDELIGRINAPILNGGDGTGNHPTQSLLDLMTIKQEFGSFDGLKIAIVGDVAHSRVAHTNINIMERLGMEVYISGPSEFDDGSGDYIDFEEAIEHMDIIMLLRVQHERHSDDIDLCVKEYHQKFGLTEERVSKMKEHAIIMHPAPFNRGVEIADEVVECEKSRIFKQMENGVYTRMAVLKRAFEDGE